MAIATGVAKKLYYKAESAWGTAPGTSGAQDLRRVTSTLNLEKDTYQSNEVRSDYQISDFRHGVRKVTGSINGELSAGTYKDFMAAAVRRAFTAVTAITGASITVAGSGPTYTITRAAGSFLTDGIKVGQVVRLTAGSFNAANLNKNLFVISLIAATLTVMPVNGVALFAEGPIASATVSIPGKVTYAPLTGHTDPSFAIEHWHSDVSLSELYLGCKVNQMALGLPPSGMSTIGLDFMGKDVTTAASGYYVSPTAATNTGIAAAVNGVLTVAGSAVALVTGLDVTVRANMSATPVVGSNTYPDIMEGRIVVGGNMSVYLQDGTFRDYFLNETEVALSVVLPASGIAAADFITLSCPRIKFGGSAKNDGETGLIQNMPWQGLLATTGGAGISNEQTSLYIHDSQA